MENYAETGCRYTVGSCVRETVAQLDVWRREAKKHEKALHSAVACADALCMLWDKLDEPTRAQIDADIALREKLRGAMNYYGF